MSGGERGTVNRERLESPGQSSPRTGRKPFPFPRSPFPALRNLARHRVRSGLAIAGIMVTTAMLFDMVLLAGGIERSFERLLLGRGFQIRVSPRGTLPLDTEATIPGAGAVGRVLEADPDIVQAGALLGASLFGRRGDSLVTLFGYGVDPAAQAVYQLERGRDLTRADSAGLLLSEPAANLLGVRPGDSVTLVSRLDPQVAGAAVVRRLEVLGVARWLYDYPGQPSVGVLVPVLQDLTRLRGEDRVSAFVVKAREESDLALVTERLRTALPYVEVNSIDDFVRRFRERLVYFRQLSYILGTISIVITVLLVSTLMTITVNERLGEIATLRAIGISRRSIVRDVMLEGALLTAAGGVLGVALGAATARYLDRILTSFPGLPAAISFFVPRPGSLVVAALVVVLTGVLAGAWPALAAARAPIAATLRTEAT